MKRFFVVALPLVLLLVVVTSVKAEDRWAFEVFLGSAYNFTTPLYISQSGYDDIELNAQYDTKPAEGSPYYAWRISRWKENRAWELELIHHKLYLRNKPPEVQHFEISHGYNLLTVNRAWDKKGFVYRIGAGVVITHPETTVREKGLSTHKGILNKGFYISGFTGQVAAGKKFYLLKKLFANIEGKFTASYARIPIEDGDADVPNVAVHGLFGLGYDF